MKYKLIPSFSLKDVDEITLLSIDEWKSAVEHCEHIPKYTGWWWLRSPGNYHLCVAGVFGDGDVDVIGGSINVSYGVRPAFRIVNLKYKIGSKIIIKNTMCTVIDNSIALSDTVICEHRFDLFGNDYDTSEIRKYINSQEFKKMI